MTRSMKLRVFLWMCSPWRHAFNDGWTSCESVRGLEPEARPIPSWLRERVHDDPIKLGPVEVRWWRTEKFDPADPAVWCSAQLKTRRGPLHGRGVTAKVCAKRSNGVRAIVLYVGDRAQGKVKC